MFDRFVVKAAADETLGGKKCRLDAHKRFREELRRTAVSMTGRTADEDSGRVCEKCQERTMFANFHASTASNFRFFDRIAR
jgi:hypothetical protein